MSTQTLLIISVAIVFLFFKFNSNRSLKIIITVCLGFFAFVCVLLFPVFQKAYFERQRLVNASDSNIYTIDLRRDHNAIKEKLKINEQTKIEDFNADFEYSGAIKALSYSFLIRNSEGFVIYNVYYSSEKNEYSVNPTKASEWVQYSRLIDEDQFFYALSRLNLEQVKLKNVYTYYSLKCTGDYASWSSKDWNNYLITANEIKKLKVEELPVEGYGFWIFGNKLIEKSSSFASYCSESNSAYILTDMAILSANLNNQ